MADEKKLKPVGWSELTIGKRIYESLSSVIYLAEYKGSKCVLKKTRITTEEAFERFEKEVEFLTRCAHRNIIQPLGLCHEAPHFGLVLPYSPKASIFELLHLPTRVGERYEAGPPLGAKLALLLSLDIARAVQHLHRMDIVHRDLKPANVLLSDDFSAFLIDLEISSDLKDVGKQKVLIKGRPSRGFHHAFLAGTLFYMAPELLLKKPYSLTSDIYALGVTINEMMTGVIPFSDVRSSTEQMHTVVEAKYNQATLMRDICAIDLRPSLFGHDDVLAPEDAALVQPVSDMISRCWQADVTKRPSADEVVKELEGMLQRFGMDPAADRAHLTPHRASALPATPAHMPPPDFDGRWKYEEKDQDAYKPVVASGVISSPGTRGGDRMEDAHSMGRGLGAGDLHVWGVFDGHGGAGASKFAAQHLLKELGSAWSDRGFALSELPAALKHTFTSLNNRFLMTKIEDNSGCTAIVSVLAGRHLYVANAGDCRAVLCRAGQAVQLTADHTASNVDEQARIKALGKGTIVADSRGTLRLDGKLQVTRSMGDRLFIKSGLTAEPEITSFEIGQDDEFLVLATDGIWDFLSNDQVMGYIHDTVKHPDYAPKRIVSEALATSDDNLTCVVAFLQKCPDLEKSTATTTYEKMNLSED